MDEIFSIKVVKFGYHRHFIFIFYLAMAEQQHCSKRHKKNKLTLYPRSVSSFASLTLFTAEKRRQMILLLLLFQTLSPFNTHTYIEREKERRREAFCLSLSHTHARTHSHTHTHNIHTHYTNTHIGIQMNKLTISLFSSLSLLCVFV